MMSHTDVSGNPGSLIWLHGEIFQFHFRMYVCITYLCIANPLGVGRIHLGATTLEPGPLFIKRTDVRPPLVKSRSREIVFFILMTLCMNKALAIDKLKETINLNQKLCVIDITDPLHVMGANMILWLYSGFCWCHRILVGQLQNSGGAFWAITGQGNGLCVFLRKVPWLMDYWGFVVDEVVFPQPKVLFWILWRIDVTTCRNITGMVSWWRLVARYSCSLLCNIYACLPFTLKVNDLRNSSRPRVILFGSSCQSLHIILWVDDNGFADAWPSV